VFQVLIQVLQVMILGSMYTRKSLASYVRYYGNDVAAWILLQTEKFAAVSSYV